MTLRFEYSADLDRFAVTHGTAGGEAISLRDSPEYASLEYLRYVPLGGVSLDEVESTLMRAPREVCCAVTTACDMACSVCIADGSTGGSACVPLATFKRTLESVSPDVKRVTITGGEPTLHPDLPELMEQASRCGRCVVLSTNGHDLRGALGALAAAEGAILAVSLHGPPAMHDRHVGLVGSHADAAATMAAAVDQGRLVHVLSIATEETLPWLSDLVLSLVDSGIVEHRINLIKPAGRIGCAGVTYEQVARAVGHLQVPHKLSVKRRDQPQLFLDHEGALEVRSGRQY